MGENFYSVYDGQLTVTSRGRYGRGAYPYFTQGKALHLVRSSIPIYGSYETLPDTLN